VNAPTGTVYYVAVNEPGASDDNNGLYPTYQDGQDGPWLTIQRAASTMTAGDVTYVRAGTYYESGISFAHSGAPGAPITLANYQSEEVVIDGSQATDDYPGIWIVEGRSHYVIQGFTIRNMPDSGIATDESTTEPYQDITIRDCILHDNGWSGIDLAAVDGFVVDNVEAYDNAYYGLDIISSSGGALSAANGVVRNSSFYNHTGDDGHGLAINQGHDITVSDSVAYHNTSHGFDVSDWPKYGDLSYNITIERNFSYDNGLAGFAINSDSHHVVYRNNVAWRNGAAWSVLGGVMSGFLCYEGCWHVEWVNNVSLENSDAGFWVEDQLGIYGAPDDNLLVFKNNIAYNNDPEGEAWGEALVIEGDNTWQVVATHNDWSIPPILEVAVTNQGTDYTPEDINNGAFQTGNISVEPQFVDATVPDVHLQSSSPCIDAGVDVGLPYLGSAPDIGAFEFGKHPDLSTSTKRVSPSILEPPGTLLTSTLHYTITLSNTGDLTATAASLTDTLPLSLALTAGPTCPGYTCGYNAGSHAITWTGSLAAGASTAIIYTGWVSTVIGEGEPLFIANTAQVNDGASVPFTISAWVAVNPYLIYLPLLASAWR
jgi:hypothetical protein